MSITSMHDGRVVLHQNDCRDVLRGLADNSIDSVVTDPPYALVSIQKRFGKPGSAPVKIDDPEKSGCIKAAYARASAGFMGKTWDTGEVAFSEEFWAEVLRVLKPGGHVVAFSGTRTYHRMAVAIEDAGFEIRDQLGWVYGCLDDQTMAITTSGAMPYHKINQGDLVLAYEGETVLDNTMGSGSTGVAARNTGRNFIGIERDPEYFSIAEKRINGAVASPAKPANDNRPADLFGAAA